MTRLALPPILTADDYAMTAGVSRGIATLAAGRRISATSALVTLPRWSVDAPALRDLRGDVAVGLHLNLTLGAPTGPAPTLAPGGVFRPLADLIKATFTRRIDPREVRVEIRRQLDLFEAHVGFAPDHVDGHQHVQVLPAVRGALFDEIASRYPVSLPLLRDPSERLGRLAGRHPARMKAAMLTALSLGFGVEARRRGLRVNTRFAGVTGFATSAPFAAEIVAALDRRHADSAIKIVMCHPGHPDAELAALDPIVERRQQEFDALASLGPPDVVIWHPADPNPARAPIDWPSSPAEARR